MTDLLHQKEGLHGSYVRSPYLIIQTGVLIGGASLSRWTALLLFEYMDINSVFADPRVIWPEEHR